MVNPVAFLPFALLIGLLLGSLGSGGAILALPVLVYGAQLPAKQAIAVSQLVVGTAALIGALLQARAGRIQWRAVLVFALAGVPATRLGSYLNHLADTHWLLLGFAVVVMLAGLRLLQTAEDQQVQPFRLPLVMIAGLGVGFLTGLLGVGGGFLLVPAMIAFAGLECKQATASSLPVIAANCIASAIDQRGQWQPVWQLAALFLSVTLVGTFFGLRLGQAASDLKLKQALGIVLLAVGAGVGWMNWHSL